MVDDSGDITLLGHAAQPSRGENAQVVLREIVALQRALLTQEESGSIDLRALTLTADDYELLREILGEGEIHAEITSYGVTRIYQTEFPGVWWVAHYNDEEDLIDEFIEVAFCPEGLIADVEPVREGLEALQARLLEREYLSRRPRKG